MPFVIPRKKQQMVQALDKNDAFAVDRMPRPSLLKRPRGDASVLEGADDASSQLQSIVTHVRKQLEIPHRPISNLQVLRGQYKYWRRQLVRLSRDAFEDLWGTVKQELAKPVEIRSQEIVEEFPYKQMETNYVARMPDYIDLVDTDEENEFDEQPLKKRARVSSSNKTNTNRSTTSSGRRKLILANLDETDSDSDRNRDKKPAAEKARSKSKTNPLRSSRRILTLVDLDSDNDDFNQDKEEPSAAKKVLLASHKKRQAGGRKRKRFCGDRSNKFDLTQDSDEDISLPPKKKVVQQKASGSTSGDSDDDNTIADASVSLRLAEIPSKKRHNNPDDTVSLLADMFLKKLPKNTLDSAQNSAPEGGVTLETPGIQEECEVNTTSSNRWSHLCVGPQFCGEEFNFENWDSITTVLL
jgi:hypothetical protein